jgi:uncharacterized membrane-anchored protein
MHPWTRAFLVMAIAILPGIASSKAQHASSEEDQQAAQVRQLHWVHGPSNVPLFGQASLKVPAGYMFLDQANTSRFMALSQNPASGTEYLLAPEDLRWFGIFSYSNDGYIKDDEKIDATAILTSISEGTEAGNVERRQKGWPEMHVLGWKRTPYYDGETRRLEWAIDGVDSNKTNVVNYNVRILGRGGVTSALLVVDPSTIDASVVEFKTALLGYDYVPGQRYAEYKAGDKVAEYGLAALIAGGAAAVATKTGFWKMIAVSLAAAWKLVVGAVFALFAAIGRLFKRRA